jgi:serine/threonine-protein kinase
MVTAELGSCEWFVYELRRSNLIDRGQLDQVVGEFLKHNPRAEPPALAQYFVEQGFLSQFQAERVLSNKAQGLVLGPYVLVDAIGSGSMGTVYKAISKTDGQPYAVKVLPRRSMWNVRLARRQVRSFGQFNHPAVVPFVDVGTSGGMHYLVWPLVEGETLESLVQRRGKLTPEQTAEVGVQVAGGLAASHGQGIFHGLLKPSNIMVGANNQVVILDFGIGSLLAENEGESLVDTMSTANTLTSGLDCASPESIMEPTNRTTAGDQYSFGCTLYYCLTGRYPFPEGSAVEKMMAHQFKQPTAIKELVANVPDKLSAVIERLMQKAPEARYAGADEVVEELLPLAGDLPAIGALEPAAPVSAPADGRPAGPQRLSGMAPPVFPPPVPRLSSHGLGSAPRPSSPGLAPAPRPSSPGLAPASSHHAPAPYPAPTAPTPPGNPPLDLKKLTRKSIRSASTSEAKDYSMPPGYIDDGRRSRPFNPLAFALLGIAVMVLSYLVLMSIKPF